MKVNQQPVDGTGRLVDLVVASGAAYQFQNRFTVYLCAAAYQIRNQYPTYQKINNSRTTCLF